MEFLPDLFSQRRTFSSSFAPDTPVQLHTEIDTDESSWIESEKYLEELSDLSGEQLYTYETNKKKKENSVFATEHVVGILEKLAHKELARIRPAFLYCENYLVDLTEEEAVEVETK